MFFDKKMKEYEYKVGFFLFLFLIFLVAFLVYFGIKKDIFSKRVTYYVISKSGDSIERGMPVKLSGFKIGEVDKLFLDNIDYVKIKIKVLDRYKKWFREDTKIILDQEGLIGNPYLKIIPGSENSPIVPPGSVVKLTKVAGLKELLIEAQPVVEDLKVIVASIRKITDQFLDKKGSMQRTITNLEQLTDKMLQNRGLLYYLTEDKKPVEKIDKLLTHTDELTLNLTRFITNATSRIEDLEPIEKEFLNITKDVKGFVNDLRSMKKDIDPILKNIQDVSKELKKATQDVYLLKMEAEYTLKVGNDLLENLKDKWPFKEPEKSSKTLEVPNP